MRNWLTKDFGWKIFSVILAVLIWLTIRNAGVESGAPGLLAVQNIFTNIPVSAVSSTADVRDVRIKTNVVTVTVSAAPDMMAALTSASFHAVVNLTGMDAAHDVSRHVEVSVPSRVMVLNVDPPDVTVTIPANK